MPEKGTRHDLCVLEPEDKAASSAKFSIKFGSQGAGCSNLVTPHFTKKADEMSSTNKDLKIHIDRDLDK
ncbi:hypothetical protein PS2_013204 [Malus domestica]